MAWLFAIVTTSTPAAASASNADGGAWNVYRFGSGDPPVPTDDSRLAIVRSAPESCVEIGASASAGSSSRDRSAPSKCTSPANEMVIGRWPGAADTVPGAGSGVSVWSAGRRSGDPDACDGPGSDVEPGPEGIGASDGGAAKVGSSSPAQPPARNATATTNGARLSRCRPGRRAYTMSRVLSTRPECVGVGHPRARRRPTPARYGRDPSDT